MAFSTIGKTKEEIKFLEKIHKPSKKRENKERENKERENKERDPLKGTYAGRGSYGTVTVIDNRAIKQFEKYSHVVQETIAIIFLRGQSNIVEFVSADIPNKTLTMRRYQKTLRRWMNREDRKPQPLLKKIEVIKQLLRGLMNIHAVHLVHGDIKPGNILVNETPELKVAIGDLGFISLRPYSKVERTAASYRDTVIKSCQGHDVYSTGIILLELFGELDMHEQADYKQLYKAIDREIDNEILAGFIEEIRKKSNIRDIETLKKLANEELKKVFIDKELLKDILKEMIRPEHNERPSIAQVYSKFFKETINYPNLNSHFESLYDNIEIKNIMKELAERYDIKRPNRGYKALLCHISRSKRYTETKHAEIKYATSMIFILSSVFGKRTTFNQKLAADYSGCKQKEIVDITQDMCLDEEVVEYLMNP